MKQRKYLYTLYLIIATIVISIATQVYFNYKNYQKNKHQFINEVQISLDNAVENYFADLAKKEFTFTSSNPNNVTVNLIKGSNNFITKTISTIKGTDELLIDSIIKNDNKNKYFKNHKDNSIMIATGNNPLFNYPKKNDTLRSLESLTSIFVSVTEENIHLKKLSNLLKTEFQRKQIDIPYKLNHLINNKLVRTSDSIVNFNNTIKTFANTTYIKDNEKIELLFPNQTKTYLKRGFLGILLSIMLTLAIIASLFYLLNIIKKQKAIAEIKNDFISNITHEFKTPITTIGLALESIPAFSEQNKKEKTKEYVTMGKNQLNKLTKMVEKILETATLDSKELFLQKKPTNIVLLIEVAVTKFKQVYTEKGFRFNSNQSSCIVNLDKFHFENAFNNLLDNACKYGGNLIEVSINSDKENTEILISDSGNIPKYQRNKIFDKFYRIPQGDRHDVKGFGIGLYYTKKIIEKHQGSISLLDTKNTIFKIEFPNV